MQQTTQSCKDQTKSQKKQSLRLDIAEKQKHVQNYESYYNKDKIKFTHSREKSS